MEIVNYIFIWLGVLISILSFILFVIEYLHRGKLNRTEYFFNLKENFKKNEDFSKIISKLEQNDSSFDNIPIFNMYSFVGFFEHIAISIKTGLIKKEVAYYLFSYYAITCSDNNQFWEILDRKGKYWVVFFDFVEEMKKINNANLNLSKLSY